MRRRPRAIRCRVASLAAPTLSTRTWSCSPGVPALAEEHDGQAEPRRGEVLPLQRERVEDGPVDQGRLEPAGQRLLPLLLAAGVVEEQHVAAASGRHRRVLREFGEVGDAEIGHLQRDDADLRVAQVTGGEVGAVAELDRAARTRSRVSGLTNR